MALNLISKLGVGPMSSEIIEAVFRYSQDKNVPLMLIATKSQIDWDRGYINGWSTRQYREYTDTLKAKYKDARVYICRDHCGPGPKNDDLEDVYKTLDSDIENNFDLIHVDFSGLKGSYENILEQSAKAIEYILEKSPETLIEVGADENVGDFLNDTDRIKAEIKYFKSVAPIHFFVCQTGSLTREIDQVGEFNSGFIKKVKGIADKEGVFLKEHNADYLFSEDISIRSGLIDAMNIAPQQGVVQTLLTLGKCKLYGIDPNDFLEESYKSGKWKKWMHSNSSDNKLLCSIIAGHYVFSSDAYKRIFEKISKHENFKESVIETMIRNFDIYIKNL